MNKATKRQCIVEVASTVTICLLAWWLIGGLLGEPENALTVITLFAGDALGYIRAKREEPNP